MTTKNEIETTLLLAIRYLDHPDVIAMPFALSSAAVAERARRALGLIRNTTKYQEDLFRHHEYDGLAEDPDKCTVCVWHIAEPTDEPTR